MAKYKMKPIIVDAYTFKQCKKKFDVQPIKETDTLSFVYVGKSRRVISENAVLLIHRNGAIDVIDVDDFKYKYVRVKESNEPSSPGPVKDNK